LELTRRYEARLAQQNILTGQRLHSHQWLRLYLDCCHKYSSSPVEQQSLAAFRESLPKPLHLAVLRYFAVSILGQRSTFQIYIFNYQ